MKTRDWIGTNWVGNLLIALGYFLAAKLGLILSISSTNVSPVWPPSGFAFAILFLMGRKYFIGVLLGAFFANFLDFQANFPAASGINVLNSLFIGIGNTLEAYVAVSIVGVLKFKDRFLDHYANIFKLIFSAFIACLIAASIGCGSLYLFGRIDSNAFATILRTWYLGDLSGLLLFGPFIIIFYQYFKDPIRWERKYEFLLLFIVLSVLNILLFFYDDSSIALIRLEPYLVIPMLLWAAYRFGNRALVFLIFYISILSILGTINGKGRFFNDDLNVSLLELEFYILIISTSFLMLKSTINSQHRSIEELAKGNKELGDKVEQRIKEIIDLKENYEQASKTVKLGYWEWDIINDKITWSKELYDLFGLEKDNELLSFEKYIDKIFEEDRQKVLSTVEEALKRKSKYEIIHRVGKKNGRLKWIKGQGNVLLDENQRVIKMFGTALDITDLKEQENLANKYKTMVENSIDPIFSVDLQGKIIIWNPGAQRMFGYTEQEILGQPYAKLAPDFKHEEVQEILERVKNQENIAQFETIRLLKNGDLLNVEESFSVIKDNLGNIIGAAIIIRDNTNKKELEEEKFRLIVESAPNAMVLVDSRGKIELINGQTEKLFGYSRDELIGQSMEILLPDKFKAIHPKHRESFYKDPSVRSMGQGRDLYALHKDGSEIPVEIGLNPIHTPDGIMVLAAIIDISERKKIEEKNNEMKVAEASLKMKDRFLANMSHEIRTPMNAIIGFSDLLSRTELNEEQESYIKSVKTSGENLLTIINDILDFSKIEAGKLKVEKSPVNIKNILISLEEMMRSKSIEKGIELNFRFDKINFPFVMSDKIRISQILLNLLSNAIKFTPRGIVQVRVKDRLLSPIESEMIFEIIDTGIGIKPEKIESIFERFTQAESDTTRQFGGTGLGLSITKNLVDLLGGTISVDSQFGFGSKFIVRLPFFIIKEEAYLHNQPNQIIPLSNLKEYGLKILLVEDNVMNQKLAGAVLNKIGIIFDLAQNGKIAIEHLKENKYDLIIMDLQMPEMDGYEATKVIRNTMKLKTPILAMTAHALSDEKSKCIALGMNDYLSKPFNPSDLLLRIITLCRVNISLPAAHKTPPIDSQKEQDIIDLNYLKENMGDDVELIQQMISIFILQAPEELEKLKQLHAAGNIKEMGQTAHKMKSTLSIFGFKRSTDLLRELDLWSRESTNLAQMQAHIDTIESDVQLGLASIKAIEF